MKKSIILLMFLFLISGCSVEYNLQIDDDLLKESINIIAENENDSQRIQNYAFPINAFYNDATNSENLDKIAGVEYYEKSLYNSTYVNSKLTYNFNFDNYKNNNILNYAYQNFSFEKRNGVYKIKTNAENKLKNLYNGINNLKITVTLASQYTCVENNADSISGNVYTWNISSDNFKPITFSFEKQKEDKNETSKQSQDSKENNEEKKDNSSADTILINKENEGIVILLIFVLFLLVIIGFIYFRKKK